MKKLPVIIMLLAFCLSMVACAGTNVHDTAETSEPITHITTPSKDTTAPSVEITEPVEHTHSYSSKISEAATCTTEGIMTYICSCGGGYTESIAKLGHDYRSVVTKATCTAKGYTTYTCSRCNDDYRGKYTAVAGHSWSSWETTKEPTVSTTGTAERKCTVCGDRETKTLDKLEDGHTHSYTKVVTAPTCKDDGYTTYTCTCGDSYISDRVYATGCECGFVVTKEPTCTEDGVQWMTCTICGDQLWSDIIPATGHDIVNLGSVELVREYAICPHCDVYLCELGSWIEPHAGIDAEEIMLSVCSCDPNDALLDHINDTDGSFAHHSWANAYEYVTIIESRTKCTCCGLVMIYDPEQSDFIPVDGVDDAPDHVSWKCGYCGTEHSTKEVEEYYPDPQVKCGQDQDCPPKNTTLADRGGHMADKCGAIQNLNAGSPPRMGAGCRSVSSARRGISSDRYRGPLDR
ncbi:MAG: hypothetical protein IJW45_03810 [Oscillospiraceae bacterium]|nr:hypothetical protein [Oscillospiraceae bacterium]